MGKPTYPQKESDDMKIHPVEPASTDLAHFQIHTATQFLDCTNGLNQLADKHRRIQRLATRARYERRGRRKRSGSHKPFEPRPALCWSLGSRGVR